MDKKLNIYDITIIALTIIVPIFVIPVLSNIFNVPKSLVIMAGSFFMLIIYGIRFFSGKQIQYPKSSTYIWLILIIVLNFISFFYTKNYYYTKVAVVLNVCSLIIFYFVSLNINKHKAMYVFSAISISGIMVSIVAWCQYYNSSWLPPWLNIESKAIGLIGNSNFLGSYLLFVILSLSGLVFLSKNKIRIIISVFIFFVLIALAFAKTRAAWLALFFAFPTFLMLIKNIYEFSILDYIKKPKRIIVSTIIIVCLLFSTSFLFPDKFISDMKSRKNIGTLIQRLQFASASLELLKENPVFGTGLWSYRNGVYRAQARILKNNPDFFKSGRINKPKRVHNEYLEALNDGGIVAGIVLLMFLLTIMNHGFKVVRNTKADRQTRIIGATAFSMIIAIMTNALFFFPFRINTTLFMTVITLGILEGIYINNYSLIKEFKFHKSKFSYVFIFIFISILLSVFWFRGIRPFKAEMEYFKYNKAIYHNKYKEAKIYILNAISYDQGLTRYHVPASIMYFNIFRNYTLAIELLDASIINFVGDNILWELYYTKGMMRAQTKNLLEAKELFEKALYYNPQHALSKKRLNELDEISKIYKGG